MTGDDRDPDAGSAGRAVPAAAGGFAHLLAEEFSLRDVVGGPLGFLETVLPMTLFSLVYGLGTSVQASAGSALAVSAAFAVWRIARRQSLVQALSGVVGVAIGAGTALYTGRAADFVIASLIKNSVQAVLFGGSALLGWPLIGLALGMFLGEGLHWRAVPARRRAYLWATWLWTAMFLVRLAFQVPLWLAGNAVALGLVNTVLGLPLFAAVVWGTWMLVRQVPVALPEPAPEPAPVPDRSEPA